ncbi:monoglyceride lipase-like [Phalaenopsis equestris]|uniref:monoglyceride lipase-like n=1 Tax=Phalaenopsis equestris TaxID=78828 RepID=UPI0009E1A451|nr:monoglyceride lipase-like [Phalaenopsis equestris]
MEMSSHQVDSLTSAASGLIISGFRGVKRSSFLRESALRMFLHFLQSIFLWFLILLPLRWVRSSLLAVQAWSLLRRRDGEFKKGERWSAVEEEDAKRRRALAERVEMGFSSEGKWGKGENGRLQCESFVLYGTMRNELFCRSWLPADGKMKAILVIMHGLNEHSGRYVHFASQLTASNFGVYAMDWIGHGGSDGLHGFVPSLDWVVADTEIFLEKIRSENPGVPCFLFGHSTGGAVVLKAALFSHMESMLEGIILTSPALRVKPPHAFLLAVAPLLSLVLPKYQLREGNEVDIPVSRDLSAMQAKYSDPLVYTGPIRVRTGYEILRISSYLMQNLRSVTIPFLVLHGTADKVTDPLASKDLYNEAASKHKSIKLYDGFLHDLLFELERDEIGAHIINWMEGRLQQQRS